MTDATTPPPEGTSTAPGVPPQPPPPQYGAPQYGAPPYGAPQYGAPQYGGPPPGQMMAYGPRPLGTPRSTGKVILLTLITFGIYSIYWYYINHEEMKRHSGEGLGGLVALLLALFVGIILPYLTSHEVGELRKRAGLDPKVSGLTGLWFFPGILLFFIGPFVWIVKTQGAINDYWRSQGATG